MFEKIVRGKNLIFWMFFHVLLGIVSTFSAFPLILWFYGILLGSLSLLLNRNRLVLVLLMAYLVPFELLARMAGTSPYIPYELGKYLLFFLLILGIFSGSSQGRIGWLLLVLLLPALFFDLSSKVYHLDLVFNILGPVNVCLAVIFFYQMPLGEIPFFSLLRLIIYPLVSVLAFVIFSTPNYDEIEFSLGANFATAGGFGSNQVSTILGIGAFLIFICIIARRFVSSRFWIDIFLMLLFLFQGFLTFSRGGMIGGILGITLIILLLGTTSSFNKKKYYLPLVGKYIIPAVIVAFFAFWAANNLTEGLLTERYKGETQGTLSGTKEKTLNTITTNRYSILQGDYLLWSSHPILGVGAGASRYLRPIHTGIVAHVEFSRLMAEHGILGILYFILLLGMVFPIYRSNSDPFIRALLISFWLVAIYTTFHAATRTFVTPLFLGLSMLQVNRQLIKK